MTRSEIFTLLETAAREVLREGSDLDVVATLCRKVAHECEAREARIVLQKREKTP